MPLINVTVISEHSTLLPWKIANVAAEETTIESYFETTVTASGTDIGSYRLSKAYLGPEKKFLGPG